VRTKWYASSNISSGEDLTLFAGHISTSKSRFEAARQYSKGVSLSIVLCSIKLTIIRMLYEFHRQQNGKKPGTVHATYLISGTKRKEESVSTNGGVQKDGEDDYMQSSPFINSSMPQYEEGTGESGVLSITLVREENLEGMLPSSQARITLMSCRGAVTI
jgi:hypothetical protein